MRKKIVGALIITVFSIGTYLGYGFYQHHKEKERRDSYYQNLVDTSSPTVEVLRDSIQMKYRNEKKTIHIYVPPEYSRDTSSRFPVIYLMDGESSFNDIENMGPEWQVDEVINKASEAGQKTAIVIGINQSEDRDAEYTPFVNDENPNAHGEQFTNWVADDLKTWVDTNYRTLSDASSTTIGGISRSGMMAYYMLMARPNVFGNALIQSPSMWVDHDRLLEMELSSTELADKKIFVSVGGREGRIMIPHAKQVYEKFKAQGLGDDQLKFAKIKKEGHWHITWRKSFAIAYPWLMGNT